LDTERRIFMNGTYRNVVLVGMPGCGKTTVGRALSAKLGWPLVDSDQRIVEREGRSINDIFASNGEPYFRNVESEVIFDVLSGQDQVVATGGGAVLAERNREAMSRGGLVVRLYAPIETIIERLREDKSRPLLAGDMEERLRGLAKAREHAYDFAHVMVDTTEGTLDDVVGKIINALQS
jgi:shikimate kinase